MTTRDQFIEDLKAKGYIQGDLSTLPSDISDADRRKVEQFEADEANERMKNTDGKKPELGSYHVSLNPNQYGFAEQAAKGDDEAKPEKAAKPAKKAEAKPEPKVEAKTDPVDKRDDGAKD